MKKFRKIIAIVTLSALIFLTFACGDETELLTNIFSPELIASLDPVGVQPDSICYFDGSDTDGSTDTECLYMIYYKYDDGSYLRRIDSDGGYTDTPIDTANSVAKTMTLDADGNILLLSVVFFDADDADTDDNIAAEYHLTRLCDGNIDLDARLDLSGAAMSTEIPVQPTDNPTANPTANQPILSNPILSCGIDCLYIADGDRLYCFDFDGSLIYSEQFGGEIAAVGENQIAVSEADRVCVYAISSDGIGEPTALPVDAANVGRVVFGYDGSCYADLGDALYRIDSENQLEVCLDWANSSINPGIINRLIMLDDSNCIYYRMNAAVGREQFIRLERVPDSEVMPKTVLTLAVVKNTTELSAQIEQFNQTNGLYRVEILDYSPASRDPRAIERLKLDLAAGNTPDLIQTSQSFSIANLAGGDVALDLYNYIGQMTDTDLFLDGILERFEVDGRLPVLPYTFSIETVCGKVSNLGGIDGWDFDAFAEFARGAEDRGSKLFFTNRRELLTMLCAANLDQIAAEAMMSDGNVLSNINTPSAGNALSVDNALSAANTLSAGNALSIENALSNANTLSNTNAPSAEATLLARLLEYAAGYNDDYPIAHMDADEYAAYEADQNGIYRRDEYLLRHSPVRSFLDYMKLKPALGEEIVFVGYPTSEGSGSYLRCQFGLSISSRSENPDGAWEFMRSLLDASFADSVEFPTTTRGFDEFRARASELRYYVDASGRVIGSEVERADLSEIFLTEADIDKIERLIAGASVYPEDERALGIIWEDAQNYYAGTRGLGDTVDVILSRLGIYFAEQD